jgi:hypothetical protein
LEPTVMPIWRLLPYHSKAVWCTKTVWKWRCHSFWRSASHEWSGVEHSEMNASATDRKTLQLWVFLTLRKLHPDTTRNHLILKSNQYLC